MKQIEVKAYSRQEIADVLGLDAKDSRHFKRNLENKLNKLGYEFIYTSKIITITKAPETPIDRLKELMLNEFKLDIQVDAYSFACFIYAIGNMGDEFNIMPWDERINYLKEAFNIEISRSTMLRWAEKLYKNNMMVKNKHSNVWWMTINLGNGEKSREMVNLENPRDKKALDDYLDYRKERRQFWYDYYTQEELMPHQKANGLAYQQAMKDTYSKFHIYYFECGEIVLNAINEDAVKELYELVEEIVESES